MNKMGKDHFAQTRYLLNGGKLAELAIKDAVSHTTIAARFRQTLQHALDFSRAQGRIVEEDTPSISSARKNPPYWLKILSDYEEKKYAEVRFEEKPKETAITIRITFHNAEWPEDAGKVFKRKEAEFFIEMPFVPRAGEFLSLDVFRDNVAESDMSYVHDCTGCIVAEVGYYTSEKGHFVGLIVDGR